MAASHCALIVVAEAISKRVTLLLRTGSVAVIRYVPTAVLTGAPSRTLLLLLKALLMSMTVVSRHQIPSAIAARATTAGPTARRRGTAQSPRALSQRGGTLAPTPGHPAAARILGGGTTTSTAAGGGRMAAGRHALQHALPLVARGDCAGRSRRRTSGCSSGLLLPSLARRGPRGKTDGAHGTPQAGLGGRRLTGRHGEGSLFASTNPSEPRWVRR